MTNLRAESAVPPLSLSDPVWTVKHVDARVDVSTDTARECTFVKVSYTGIPLADALLERGATPGQGRSHSGWP